MEISAKEGRKDTHTLAHTDILIHPSTETHTHTCILYKCEHTHTHTHIAAADGSLIVLSVAVMKLEMLLAPLNRIHTGSIGPAVVEC